MRPKTISQEKQSVYTGGEQPVYCNLPVKSHLSFTPFSQHLVAAGGKPTNSSKSCPPLSLLFLFRILAQEDGIHTVPQRPYSKDCILNTRVSLVVSSLRDSVNTILLCQYPQTWMSLPMGVLSPQALITHWAYDLLIPLALVSLAYVGGGFSYYLLLTSVPLLMSES